LVIIITKKIKNKIFTYYNYMFPEVLLSLIFFIESILGCFILPKLTQIDSVYGNSISGGVLTGLATVSLIPRINSFHGFLTLLITIFVASCGNTAINAHNYIKTISIWTNCFGVSCFGIISGFSLGVTDGYEYIQLATSLIISFLAISYSVGNIYIEYTTQFIDKLPILMFSLSTPVGLILGKLLHLTDTKSSVMLGISSGTFLFMGMNNILVQNKKVSDKYLENNKKYNQIFISMSVLCGLTISIILQNTIFTLIMDSINITDSTSLNLTI